MNQAPIIEFDLDIAKDIADQCICHPVSRSVDDIERAGEAIKYLLWVIEKTRATAAVELDRAQRGEPVAWMTDEEPPRVASVYTKTDMPRASAGSFCIPLYTAPQPSQPKRKPMPDNEMNDLAFQCGIQREDARDPGIEEFARAIEAFHGIKP